MENIDSPFKLLLSGFDSVYCSYYLKAGDYSGIDFAHLALEKEKLRHKRFKDIEPINIGGLDFVLSPGGTSTGYPFFIKNDKFEIAFGEMNKPSFYVKFLSESLWRETAYGMNQYFLDWAGNLGLTPYKPESLSRVDFTFDYHLPVVDFNSDSFLSPSLVDVTYRKSGEPTGFVLGKGLITLKLYDKIDEIINKSGKIWFYKLWNGLHEDVWRIEWQTRKEFLTAFKIKTFEELKNKSGDILKYLANRDTVRLHNPTDSNKSRWLLHPLWLDLQKQIETLPFFGLTRMEDNAIDLEWRLTQIAISMYGNLKKVAAIGYFLKDGQKMSPGEALNLLEYYLDKIDDRLLWKTGVERRIGKMRAGVWKEK